MSFYNGLSKKIMNVKQRIDTDHTLSSNEVLTNFTQNLYDVVSYTRYDFLYFEFY